MGNIIGAIIFGLIAIGCFVFSFFQFHEKGFLFNNAYIYASKQERETMNKRPHYIQSGVVFIMIGIIFTINAINVILKTDWLYNLVVVIAIIAIIYAIVSSIMIAKNQK